MFSFHKPRVYRSAEGCCICRAKSSSSRFTDSRKYELDSVRCFNLKTPRLGEICNACVLLVKRYKRLPPGSTRHWGHVVDARAGPGTKSIIKYKKYKDDNGEITTSASNTNSNLKRTQNTKTIIAEKFSKIFKKSKKNSTTTTTATATQAIINDTTNSTTTSSTHGKRKSALLAQSTWEQHSLPTTPDSLDSDYEDSRITYASSVVQFQTQTRASSYRSRTHNNTESNNNSTDIRCGVGDGGSVLRKHSSSILKWKGSKRRKCFKPYKNRRAIDNVAFFDYTEWEERKSCCGIIYECETLGGALLLDLEDYKPCAEHQLLTNEKPSSEIHIHQTVEIQKPTTIIATMPAVVKLAPPSLPPPQSTKVNVVKPTPVLKKHHLFFKRQSESFPHVDVNVVNNNNISNHNSNSNKTELIVTATNMPVSNASRNSISSSLHQQQQQQQKSNNLPFSINSTSISASAIAAGTSSASYMPRHSTAKITTLSPPIGKGGAGGLTAASAASLNKKHNLYMQNLKAGGGGDMYALQRNIHCFMKSGEIIADVMQDGKNIVKDFDKTLIMGKPISSLSAQHQILSSAAGSSPTSSTSSSSSSTKFSDNSSDSGFDENMQERKSASPLQEDTERKIQTRSGVQTLFLANGLQVQGHQNVVLAGNEYAVKILQGQRRQQLASTITQQPQQQQNNRLGITPVLAPTCTATGSGVGGTSNVVHASRAIIGSGGIGSHAKMRAIYNSNAIQHENGVTTIVPASSLAATTQTAAMNALSPSTVTITPAPLTHHHHQQPNHQQPQQQQLHQQQLHHHQQVTNMIATGKKLSTATTITNQQSNIIGSIGGGGGTILGGGATVAAATHLNNIINNHNFLNNTTNINSNSNLSSLNQTQQQKIILIKNSAKYNNNNNSNCNNNIGSVVNMLPTISPSIPTTTATTLNNHKQSVCKKLL